MRTLEAMVLVWQFISIFAVGNPAKERVGFSGLRHAAL